MMHVINKNYIPDLNTNAVIYCRVSSIKQATQGSGLTSQETRCREYAKYKAYDVAAVFTDDMSGGSAARPGMQEMLGYLRKHRIEAPVVIIDDISWLSGDSKRTCSFAPTSAKRGALESPSIEFGEDSDSILVENLLASFAQHQREKNGEQTRNRMRARIMSGYWCFKAPLGFRYERKPGHGNMLVRDEPLATTIQEAFEGLASGRFAAQAEVKRFFEAQFRFPKCLPNGEVNRAGFPGGPNFWKDGVHGNQGRDEAVPGGAARARGSAGARAGGGAWLAVVSDPLDRRKGRLQR